MGNAVAWKCSICRPLEVDSWELEQEPPPKSESVVPLLMHFDVNKTILLSDSLIMKSVEDGIREGITELYWGIVRKDDAGAVKWDWTSNQPSVEPPENYRKQEGLQNYLQYCKAQVEDKEDRKKAVRTFSLVPAAACREDMERSVRLALKKMELPKDIVNTDEAEKAGLKGTTFVMLPAFFYLVTALQDQGRKFAILFRSFGDDHHKIKTEWNAFCELRHPVFSKLIKAKGPMDGTRADLPDRRVSGIHTMYRDARGPMLILDTFTNGPSSAKWDSWAKAKPKPKDDTRRGRDYVRNELAAKTVEGMSELGSWLNQILRTGETAAIKDDWAWWQFHNEQSRGGKLLPLIHGEDTQQVFFDDNVELDDPRIVDCRYPDGSEVPADKAMHGMCIKVNPVEALIDKFYFLRKLDKAEKHLAAMRAESSINPFGHILDAPCGVEVCCMTSPGKPQLLADGHVASKI